MIKSQIAKLYLSKFLLGLVFWYGIEKLFMLHIGIDSVGIGIAAACYAVLSLTLDIPTGILADKWSRKGVLALAAVSLATGSVMMGFSEGLLTYLPGYLFYGLYTVMSAGAFQALVYDTLHEDNRVDEYSKVVGRANALKLVGASVANIFSGFFASHFGYTFDFLITVVPSVLGVVLILSIKEPRFHRAEKKETMLKQIRASVTILAKIRILRALTVVVSIFAIVENFKGGFGQLYMLRYVDTPQLIGLLWAAYAITWAIGNAIAHRLHNHLTLLIILSTVPLILMSFVDSGFSLVLFMLQAIVSAAMLNQIETRVQNNTPSSIRASTLSVLSSIGRAIIIPCGLVIGWLIRDYNVLWALRFVAVLAVIAMSYWLIVSYQPKKDGNILMMR